MSGVRIGIRAAFVAALSSSLGVGVATGTAGGSRATASPYATGARGYDISYPNCRQRPARPPDFAIVGVNGGRPFTFNPCLARQSGWSTAGPRAVYLNTGLASVYRKRLAPECVPAGGISRAVSFARAVGCSEAATSLRHVDAIGLARPDVWWLDVEPSNTWSASLKLNSRVLDAMIAYLARLRPAPLIGIYSRPSWWREIMGGWATGVPEWIPGGCRGAFSTGPVWLAQLGGYGLDVDTGC